MPNAPLLGSWDVACCDVVIPFTREILSGKVPFGTLQDLATLILDYGISMKFEESLLQIILILSLDGVAYPIHDLSPNRETQSTSPL